MVKITNGKEVFEVTRGAFDGIYSRQGYTILDETKPAEQNEANTETPEKTDDELFIEEIIGKPISSWNKDEVKRFASIKDIDITGTKNVTEAKDIIKQYLDANV